MNANLEMMNAIYKNAQMGQDTLTQLSKIAEDEDFANLLVQQKNSYKKICNESSQWISQQNAAPKGVGKMAELSTYLTINVQTLIDKTPTHLAGMVMQGSVMGIIDITRNLHTYHNAEQSVLDIGYRLLDLEEYNLDECKKYL